MGSVSRFWHPPAVPRTLTLKWLSTDFTRALRAAVAIVLLLQHKPTQQQGLCRDTFQDAFAEWIFAAHQGEISSLYQIIAWQVPSAGQESHRSNGLGFTRREDYKFTADGPANQMTDHDVYRSAVKKAGEHNQ